MKTALEKSREELLIENQRLRGDLLTIASRICHDLRTPLGGIIASCEALNEILAENDPSALPLVTASLASTEDLAKLIKAVSFLTKATARPRILSSVNMGEAASGALDRLERKIQTREAIVSKVEAWPFVTGISEWLEMIWRILLVNALEHAGASPNIRMGWREEKDQYKFWVGDNGPGVPPDRCHKLFQPFDQLHETNSARGLGLSIVQRLVELQGGACGYERTPEGGSCFYFRLPANLSHS
jgi:signal transduction histidine kinase